MGRRESKAGAAAGPSSGGGEEGRPRRPTTERWLLTRKTWRYMADAGRRLIPEGLTGDRPEDIPRIKEHFSKMCRKEPRFLLWRKASFPGASPAARRCGRRGRKEGRAGSEEPPTLETLVEGSERAGAAFGISGSSEDVLDSVRGLPRSNSGLHSSVFPSGSAGPSSSSSVDWSLGLPAPPPVPKVVTVDRWVQTEPISEWLTRRMEEALAESAKEAPPRKEIEAAKEADAKGRRGSCPRDDLSPSVGDTIMRYLRMARKKSVDGDKSEKFRTVNYDRVTVKISEGCSEEELIDGGMRRGISVQSNETWLKLLKGLGTEGLTLEGGVSGTEVCGVGERDETPVAESVRLTIPISQPVTCPINSSSPPSTSSTAPASPPSSSPASPPRGTTQQPSFLAQLLHGLQHHHHRHSAPPSPVLSPPNPSSPPPIAGSLPTLSAAAAAAAAASASGAPPVAAMQKSKSSSSVVGSLAGRGPGGLVAKRIWRPRSRSTQGRTSPTTAAPVSPPCAWIPQGGCRWNCVDTGRQVALTDTNLLMLSEVERRVLQKVALAKLQALNLGASVRIPTGEEAAAVAKPRRRPYLLRRKARTTTSPLDGGRRSGDANSGGGLVFGIPISQCIENETAAGRSGRDSGGSSSRSSAGSLSESTTSPPSPRRDSSDERPREGVEWRWSDGWPEEGAPPHPRVPQVVIACLSHIRNHGLHTLGIFRVGSSKKRVRQLREDLDMGRETDLSASQCPHDVAALLKEYFRDLPEPLLCRELYTAFVRTQGIRNRRLQFEALQHLVQLLPPVHRDTLCLLLDFLAMVARHAEDKRDPHSGEWLSGNKMDSGNLATLFAPNILRRSTGDFRCDSRDEAAEDRLDVINVVRCMIEHNRELFMVSAELLDEIYVHMMDTHPEALDDLLRSRCPPQAEEIWEDHLISDGVEHQIDVHGTPPRRRVWSREEFLHGTAGMGGPDLAMMPRHRGREGKGSKKRTKEPQPDLAARGKSVQEERPRGGSVADLRATRGSIGGAERSEEAAAVVTTTSTSRRAAGSADEEEDSPETERGIITASLRIPVPAHVALEDIPFIEDGVSELGRAPPARPTTLSSSLPPSPSPMPSMPFLPAPERPQPSSSPVPAPAPTPATPPTTLTVAQSPHVASAGPSPSESRTATPEMELPPVPLPSLDSVPTGHRNEPQAEGKSSPSEEDRMAEATRRGAVRSLTTADMSRRQRSATRGEAEAANKRYARRYTDGRHAAAVLPEVSSPRGPVWKRREIIASEPRRRTAQ